MLASVEKSSRSRPTIALFIDGDDWHARRLERALRAQGAMVITTSLRHCAFDTRRSKGLDIPGFDDHLPDGVFVRSVAAGSFEQITFRLGILHALRECGVRVWNDARAIERCVDKSATTFHLAKAGLPSPPTRTVEGRLAAEEHIRASLSQQVLKPLFGSRGRGVLRVGVGAVSDLPPAEEIGNVYYLQDYLSPIGSTYEDWRLLVSSNRVIAAMRRRSERWITNLHQGGAACQAMPEAELVVLAASAAKAVGADYAGVDIMCDRDGRPFVLEVNSMPAWKGLQSVTQTNIAERLTGDFLATLASGLAS
jgi:tetrahydromethanopterin:alpha-L-glutamate ligase